jgi:hypothetical protein
MFRALSNSGPVKALAAFVLDQVFGLRDQLRLGTDHHIAATTIKTRPYPR